MAAALAILLVASWWVMRADTRPLLGSASADIAGWLAAAAEAPRSFLARSRGESAAPRSQGAPEARLAAARLAHGPTATFPEALTAAQAEPAPTAEARSQPEPRGPASPTPAEPNLPSEPPTEQVAAPSVEVAAEAPAVEVVVEAPSVSPPVVGDVLLDLSPGDFQGSLGSTVSVGGAATGIDLQLQEGTLAVDTSLRVDVPEVSGLGGPASTAVQLQVAPSEIATGVALGTGGAGAGVQIHADPGQVGTNVALDLAGSPVALAVEAESEGLVIDLSTGGLVPALLGGNEPEVSTRELLPILPLDLRLH